MDRKEVLDYVSTRGWIAQSELKEHFSGDNQEILGIILDSLIETNTLKVARYQSYFGEKGEIYYIPAE